MRRQDLGLLARARGGDAVALLEAGRRYLQGLDGFPRHVSLGLEYLTRSCQSADSSAQAQCFIAETLPLHELVRLEQLAALRLAAKAGRVAAQAKLAFWTSLTVESPDPALAWLETAAGNGHAGARQALNMHRRQSTATVSDLTSVLTSVLSDEPGIDLVAVLPIVIASALQARSAVLVSRALKLAFEKVSSPPPTWQKNSAWRLHSRRARLRSHCLETQRRSNRCSQTASTWATWVRH